mmetsp:Transcript_2759/g.7237  ORF Transcript_2759/g.7237 Transcript_2759/m.7237 type:complete len:279 (+) Transcript_2759:212-1048(+)
MASLQPTFAPTFSPQRAQTTDSDVKKARLKNGQCELCGNQTHRVKRTAFRYRALVPLTNEWALNGRCLLSRPVPAEAERRRSDARLPVATPVCEGYSADAVDAAADQDSAPSVDIPAAYSVPSASGPSRLDPPRGPDPTPAASSADETAIESSCPSWTAIAAGAAVAVNLRANGPRSSSGAPTLPYRIDSPRSNHRGEVDAGASSASATTDRYGALGGRRIRSIRSDASWRNPPPLWRRQETLCPPAWRRRVTHSRTNYWRGSSSKWDPTIWRELFST